MILVILIITYTSFTHINTFDNWDLRLDCYKSTIGFKIDLFFLVTTYTFYTIHETFEIWNSRWDCSYNCDNDIEEILLRIKIWDCLDWGWLIFVDVGPKAHSLEIVVLLLYMLSLQSTVLLRFEIQDGPVLTTVIMICLVTELIRLSLSCGTTI